MNQNVMGATRDRHPSTSRIALGLFLLVLAVYVLTSPGRIDMVDGQARFDVAYNWLHSGQPLINDGIIMRTMAVPGRNNIPYSHYGPPASVIPMPLIALASPYDNVGLGASQFVFSLTSPILGAGLSAVLFLFYLELGLGLRAAFVWALICAFATMMWPLSTTTFDNAQHAFFALSSTYLGFLSARRKSNTLAIAGGFSASVLLLYQEYFLIIIPALALSTIRWTGSNSAERIDQENGSPSSALTSKVSSEIRNFLDLLRSARKSPGEARSSCVRFCLWLLTAVVIGSALFCWYNNVRFGSPFDSGKFRFSSQRGIPTFGNPVAGFGTLMLSPGKSVFLYSPTVILALMGIRRLYQQQRALAVGVCLASVALVLFLSCISFAGGDWCWGPRYLGVVVALLSLAVPFAWASFSRARIVPIVIALSFAIQVMAVSVENTRFFLELGLNDAFWVEDPWFYFKHSALLARPAETLSLIDPPPLQADYFNALRDPEYCTYTVLGPPGTVPRSKAPTWITHFKIFYLPKPWPLWMSWIPPESRPINLQIWLLGMGGLLLMALTVLNPLYERPIWRKLAEVEGVGREADAL